MPLSLAVAMLSRMKSAGSIAFTIKVDPQRFPAELWPKFQASARAKGEVPIDALRQLLERYIADAPPGATP